MMVNVRNPLHTKDFGIKRLYWLCLGRIANVDVTSRSEDCTLGSSAHHVGNYPISLLQSRSLSHRCLLHFCEEISRVLTNIDIFESLKYEKGEPIFKLALKWRYLVWMMVINQRLICGRPGNIFFAFPSSLRLSYQNNTLFYADIMLLCKPST